MKHGFEKPLFSRHRANQGDRMFGVALAQSDLVKGLSAHGRDAAAQLASARSDERAARDDALAAVAAVKHESGLGFPIAPAETRQAGVVCVSPADPFPNRARSEPTAASGVRHSNSQIVGCSQDASHPPGQRGRPDQDRRCSSRLDPAAGSDPISSDNEGPSRSGPATQGVREIATVGLSNDAALMLRLAASAAGVSIGEAVTRAVCHYAKSLGLQVLADAVALDPDLARDLGIGRAHAPGVTRFRSGA